MENNKNFKPYIPADKVTPELTVTSIIMGIILAIEIFKMTDEEFEEKKGTLTKGIPA